MDTLCTELARWRETNIIVESNAVLKLKFKKLHSTVVGSVRNTEDIVDFLLQEEVIGYDDMNKVLEQGDPRQQCRNLLALLNTSDHPQAYVKLYLAIKDESDLRGLIDRIDNYTDESLSSSVQDIYISEPTGFRFFL